MKRQTIQKKFKLMLIIVFLSSIACKVQSQGCNAGKVTITKQFTMNDLESKFASYSLDAGFKTLLADIANKGFKRIEKNAKTEWGFQGNYIADTVLGVSSQEAEICAFDFYKKTSTGFQFGSILWRKVGNTTYKAFVIFPENANFTQTSFTNAIEKSIEYYVDSRGQIQIAKSFGKCWGRCVSKSSAGCLSAIGACGSAAAALVGLGIGVTTPIALGIFAGCAGVFCLGPLAICAAICL